MGNLGIKQELNILIQKGIRFEVSHDKLLVKGNINALNVTSKKFLKANKQEIIYLIKGQSRERTLIKKLERDAVKPLSFSQQGLWLLDRINNGSYHYNLTSAFKISGEIDYQALNRTFLTILQRHESLRTSFVLNQTGEPVQEIQKVEEFKVRIEEMIEDSESHELEIERKIEIEANQTFNLTRDILLKVLLLRKDQFEHILIITMHHIASDGWSMGILVKEFCTLYSSYVKNESNPLSELSLQYSDYSFWQRQWLRDDVLKFHSNYWKKQLSNLPTVHNLPLDRQRPTIQSFRGSTHNSYVNKKLLKSLYDLCKSEAASLFMGIHAVFSSFLAWYSNEEDIVMGSPIANREKAEVTDLVGFFMNLLVLRSDLSKKPSLRQLIRQSKSTLEKAYEFQQMPFEKLLEELETTRNLSHNPIFQILLTLHNHKQEVLSLPGLEMQSLNISHTNAKYDLSLNITEKSQSLHLAWEYNTDLFDKSTIVRMAGHFNSLLISLLDNPDENVFNVNFIDSKEISETHRLLNGKVLEIDDRDHVMSSFYNQIHNESNTTAVICDNRSYNYDELAKRIDSVAQLLIDHGVQNGDKIGLCLLRNVDLIAAIFACFKIGAAYIPLDPVYPSVRIHQIINEVQPSCVVTLKPLKSLYLGSLPKDKVLFLDGYEIQKKKPTIDLPFDLKGLAYIIFTSGTTGRPKGIEITHLNLANLLKSFDSSFNTKAKQRWLAQTSINFDISVLELIWTISRGHTIALQQLNAHKLLSVERILPAKNIDFSVMFFGADKAKKQKYDLLTETAAFVDANNFSAVWTPERHFGEFGGAFPSPSVLSSALSVLTKNVGIRSGSIVLPLHDPIRVAEEWSLIDNLSKGRVGISIASGWQPDDFVFFNADYTNRHKEMRKRISELKNLWQGKSITRKNGIDQNFSIKIRPLPVQPDLPIWITAAGSPKTFKYAGEIGANLLTHMLGQNLEKLAANVSIYHKALIDNGFKIQDKKVTLMLHTYVDSSEQIALDISEKPFKEYLESSVKLMEPLAQELGIDVNTQRQELIDMAFNRFSHENTLIGSPKSCQKILFGIQDIGITEVACLIDFGVEDEKVLSGLEKIVETRDLYNAQRDLAELLHVENQKNEVDLINNFKLTHVQMTPSQSKLILDLSEQKNGSKLTSIRHWFVGGEALNQNVIKRLSSYTNCKFYNMYGPTETTVWSAWRGIDEEDIHIGGPIANTSLLLLNEFGQQVPMGVVGELSIGGLGVGRGYYKNDKLTEERFRKISNNHLGNGRYYRTGDLMKLKNDGNIEYIGRKDNQVKVNGYRIELEEIENTVMKVSGVKNCKVLPKVENGITSLRAFVVNDNVVYGSYRDTSAQEQPKPYSFADGSTIYHHSDRQLAMLYQEVIEEGIYFKHGITIPENGLVLDVGANVGAFSIDVNQRYPNATIIAFEPIPQTFAALKKNFEHRQIKGCVLNCGVSNKKEHAIFQYYPEMAGMSGRFADEKTIVDAVGKYIEYDQKVLKNNVNAIPEEKQRALGILPMNMGESKEVSQYLSSLYESEEVECQLTTISHIINELNIKSIDLLKLDVEKSECLVLEGIRSEHWEMIRHLAIEVDGDDNLKIIESFLNEKGYDIKIDAVILSDDSRPEEENTYMLYASNHSYGLKTNDSLTVQFNTPANENTIKEFLKINLPDYMIPKEIIFTPSIPLTENGKVDITNLQMLKAPSLKLTEPNKLTNKTELAIYRIWCEVLKKENVPNHISIFEAGGNSIEIVLLHEKLQTEFGVTFSLVELFRNPTIAQQAKLILHSKDRETDKIKNAVNKGTSRRKARLARNKTL